MNIKCCPFCGGKAQKWQSKARYCQLRGEKHNDWNVGCNKCEVSFERQTLEQATRVWNERHTCQEDDVKLAIYDLGYSRGGRMGWNAGIGNKESFLIRMEEMLREARKVLKDGWF